MSFWTLHNLARAAAGQWLQRPPDLNAPVTGLSTDTRSLQPGQAFLALAGDSFDGHDYLIQAFNAGASLAIVNEGAPQVASDIAHRTSHIAHPFLVVPDTLAALQRLASAYRDTLAAAGCRIISISGSNGKTTTRHLIHTVLTARFAGTQSPKSFNNHIGVPLTLLAAREEHDFVACEIGTNHPGEIEALGAIARPDIAVIASIGREHLEFFQTIENVEREEYSILGHLREGGVAFTPRDGVEPVTEINAPSYMQQNMGYARAVARLFGLDDETILARLRDASPVEGRMQPIPIDGLTLIHDAYNANPDSMRAAIDAIATMPCGGRRIAILGDMFELGEAGPAAHAEIAAYARQWLDEVILIGDLFGGDAWADELPNTVAQRLQPGDIVLLKASRGMRLERLIPAIRQRFADT